MSCALPIILVKNLLQSYRSKAKLLFFPRIVRVCLGSFAKLRQANISFVTSVCLSVRPSVHPSVRVEHCSQWTDFHEIWYLSIFRKSAETTQVPLKSDNNNGYFTWRSMNIYDNMSLNSSLNEKCFWQICRKYRNTYFMFSNFFPKVVSFMS